MRGLRVAMPEAARASARSHGFMLVSASLFSLSGFFGLEALALFGPWVVLLGRFGVPLLLLGATLGPAVLRDLRCVSRLCLLRAGCMVASQSLFLLCADRAGLFVALLLYNTGPLFLVLLEALVRRQSLAWTSLAWAALGFGGVWLLQLQDGGPGPATLALGLASGVCYAASQFTLFVASGAQSAPSVLLQTVFWCTLTCLPPALWSLRGFEAAAHPGWLLALAWMLLGGLCSLGNQWFRTLAYQSASNVSSLAPLLYFGIVVGMALEALRSGKLPEPGQWLGAACIVGAALGARVCRRGAPARKAAALPRLSGPVLSPRPRTQS